MPGWTPDAVLAASDAWVWLPPGAERLTIAGVDVVDVVDYPEWANHLTYQRCQGVSTAVPR